MEQKHQILHPPRRILGYRQRCFFLFLLGVYQTWFQPLDTPWVAPESSFSESSIKDIEFNNVNFTKAEFLKVNLNNIDFSNCDINSIVMDTYSLKGIIINSWQCCEIAGIIGVKVKN